MKALWRLAFMTLCAAPAAAQQIQLAFPVDCQLGEECYIQQYVDHAEGSLARDFQCASLTYDGHRGTDIALPSLAQMRDGVTVRAAAPGIVVATRDGIEDKVWSPETADLDGKDCGNRVGIRHGQGWITDYCHLKNGSVAVATGDRIKTGDTLGQIGMSGRAQFPHLHFTVQKGDQAVDPFDPDGEIYCTSPSDETLWADPIAYQPGGILRTGFATSVEKSDYQRMKDGTVQSLTTADNPDRLILWAYLFGLRFGDELTLTAQTSDGAPLTDTTVLLQRNRALASQRVGINRPDPGWPQAVTATVTLMRKGALIDRQDLTISLP